MKKPGVSRVFSFMMALFSDLTNILGKVDAFVQIKLLSEPDAGYFGTWCGDFKDMRNFLGVQVHSQKGAKLMIIGSQLGIKLPQTVEKSGMYLFKMSFDPVPVVVELDVVVDGL